MQLGRRQFLRVGLAGSVGVAAGLGTGCREKIDSHKEAELEAGRAGTCLKTGGTLLVALPILNVGHVPASNLQVNSVTIANAKCLMPASFPVALSDIGAERQATIDAVFQGEGFAPGNTYLAQAEGQYTSVGQRRRFSLTFSLVLSPLAPGRDVVRTARVDVHQTRAGAGTLPPQPSRSQLFEADIERTAPVPTDPFVEPSHRTPVRARETKVMAAPRGHLQHAAHAVGASLAQAKHHVPHPHMDTVSFPTNGAVVQTGWLTAEPSGAVDSSGNVVFVTGNFFAAYSADGGQRFTVLNPDSIFPPLPAGWCDQVVRYAPSVDRFVWVRMYGSYMGGLLRVATAKPADIVANQGMAGWAYWDITGQSIGVTSVDYPDLSVGDNYVYLSYNYGGPAVIRMPLSQIDGSNGSLDFDYTNPGLSQGQSHLSQSTADEVFWAVTTSTQSMRVFSWKESDGGTYWWRDVQTEPWSNAHPTCLTPDGQDWLGSCAPGNVLGLTRRIYSDGAGQHNEVWFAWAAGIGNGFEQPYVEVVVLDRNNNFKVINQQQIWTNNNAYAYPALCTNSNGDVGLSLEAGGGPGGWENHVVGFWGDSVLYVTTSSNLGCTRYGDYVTICPDAKDPTKFDAFGYGVMAGTPPTGLGSDKPGVIADIRYIQFGRSPSG